MKNLKRSIKSSIIITLIFANSVFSQTEKYKVFEYTNEKYRFGISMEIPSGGKLSVEDFLKNKFDKEKIDLENHQKSRDKSYYSEQAVNVPYTITYLIDTVFNYNNTLSLVYKVVEENATPGLEDFYYDIYTFKFDNEKAILINKLYYLNKDKENMFKQIEHVLSKCKIFNTVNLNNLIIQIDKNKYIILLWKGILDRGNKNCIENDKLMLLVDANKSILNSIIFAYKSIKNKVYLSTSPQNNPTKMYLLKGDEVEIIEEKDKWLKIRYYGKKTIEGWIKRSDVE
jgi:hypothetical protein